MYLIFLARQSTGFVLDPSNHSTQKKPRIAAGLFDLAPQAGLEPATL